MSYNVVPEDFEPMDFIRANENRTQLKPGVHETPYQKARRVVDKIYAGYASAKNFDEQMHNKDIAELDIVAFSDKRCADMGDMVLRNLKVSTNLDEAIDRVKDIITSYTK